MLKENVPMLLMLGALTVGSILACTGGNNTPGEACTTDEDCPTNFICDAEANECAETCTTDADCQSDEECLVPQGSSGTSKLCYIKEDTNNNNNNNINQECMDNEDCGDTEKFFCNGESKCEAFEEPGAQYYVIKIEDTSFGPDACDASDPGSDLMFARLLDSAGEELGYGTQINFEFGDFGAKDNKYQDISHLNGGRPSDLESGAEQCPTGDFKDSSLVAMGCGGRVTFEFLNSGGMPISLKAGMTVEVGEYGPNCGGSDADTYDISLCTDTESAKGGSFSSCTEVQGNGNITGFGSVSVSLP